MTKDEIKALSEKIANNKATPAEKLLLLKELNATIESMRNDIAVLKDKKKLADIRNSLSLID
jgi:hypothetical protein